MRTTRRAAKTLVVAGGTLLLRPGTRANRIVRHQLDVAGRRLRYASGCIQGATYKLSGRTPDPDVIDTVLADRVRSSLGPLQKRLDLPHVHVQAQNHVVLLHGEVSSQAEANEIERAVAAVPGVIAVESCLHIGLGAGATRPSEGRSVHHSSPARQSLLDAAIAAGAPREGALFVVRQTLAALADRIPAGERAHVAAHLTSDVAPLFAPPRRSDTTPRTAPEFLAQVAAGPVTLPAEQAAPIVGAVIDAFRALVPEETADVAAVLPPDLRDLWQGRFPGAAVAGATS